MQESDSDVAMLTEAFQDITALKTIRIDKRLHRLEKEKGSRLLGMTTHEIEQDLEGTDTHIMALLVESLPASRLHAEDVSAMRLGSGNFIREDLATTSFIDLAYLYAQQLSAD